MMPPNTIEHIRPQCDCHMHFSSEQIATQLINKLPPEALGGFEPQASYAQEMIDTLDQAGIQKAFALSSAYTWGMDFLSMGPDEYDWVRFENDFSAEEADKYPDRLTPFMSINPLKKYALKEIERCTGQLNSKGVKLHFANSNVDLLDEEHLVVVQELLAYCSAQNLPVLFHYRGRQPDFGVQHAKIFIEEILLPLPELKVQMAHLGDWGAYLDVTRDVFETFIQAFEQNQALNKRRFYFDMAGVILQKPIGPFSPATPEELSHLTGQLRRWGLDRILWGSDWRAFDPGEYLQLTLEKLTLSAPEFKQIFNHEGSDLFS